LKFQHVPFISKEIKMNAFMHAIEQAKQIDTNLNFCSKKALTETLDHLEKCKNNQMTGEDLKKHLDYCYDMMRNKERLKVRKSEFLSEIRTKTQKLFSKESEIYKIVFEQPLRAR
jgi:hypothetical protein